MSFDLARGLLLDLVTRTGTVINYIKSIIVVAGIISFDIVRQDCTDATNTSVFAAEAALKWCSRTS